MFAFAFILNVIMFIPVKNEIVSSIAWKSKF